MCRRVGEQNQIANRGSQRAWAAGAAHALLGLVSWREAGR